MRRTLAILAGCLLIPTSAFAQPTDSPTFEEPGGITVIHQGNQTFWSLGGVFLPRRVAIETRTPEEVSVIRFRLPAVFNNPNPPVLPFLAPAGLQVEVPDKYAMLFVEGQLVRARGTSRRLESQSLLPGNAYPVRLRAAYVVGDKFLIEDKEVVLRGGETTAVRFDGSRALVVPLRKAAPRPGQLPAAKKE